MYNRTIVLASQSPRRIEIMGWLGIDFEISPHSFDESTICHKSSLKLTKLLAEAKAEAVTALYPNSIIIGSDALVSFDNQILEKPLNKTDQRRLIHMQNGKEASVCCSVCVIDTKIKKKVIKSKITKYKMAKVSDYQIEKYIKSGQGMDKAGGYGNQDENNMFLDKLYGCYSNLMGFPVCEVAKILRIMDVPINIDVMKIVKQKTGKNC